MDILICKSSVLSEFNDWFYLAVYFYICNIVTQNQKIAFTAITNPLSVDVFPPITIENCINKRNDKNKWSNKKLKIILTGYAEWTLDFLNKFEHNCGQAN